MSDQEKKWSGDTHCNVCMLEARTQGDTFYDCKTKRGPWAILCKDCYQEHGTTIGVSYASKDCKKITNLS